MEQHKVTSDQCVIIEFLVSLLLSGVSSHQLVGMLQATFQYALIFSLGCLHSGLKSGLQLESRVVLTSLQVPGMVASRAEVSCVVICLCIKKMRNRIGLNRLIALLKVVSFC